MFLAFRTSQTAFPNNSISPRYIITYMCSRLKIDIGFFKIFVKILAGGLSQIKGREIRKSCLIIDNVLFFWSRCTMELRSMHLLSPARKCNPLLAGWISNNVNFPYSSDDKEYICSTVSNL